MPKPTRNGMTEARLFMLMEQLSSKGQSNQKELSLGSKGGENREKVQRKGL